MKGVISNRQYERLSAYSNKGHLPSLDGLRWENQSRLAHADFHPTTLAPVTPHGGLRVLARAASGVHTPGFKMSPKNARLGQTRKFMDGAFTFTCQ
jgi:hypothetical protein